MLKNKKKSIKGGEFIGIEKLNKVKAYKFNWYDTGNIQSLKKH